MQLTLYQREDCHLCELALDVLDACGLSGSVALVDIDEDAELGVEFGLRIPVLERTDGEQLDWPFRAEAVRGFVGRGQLPD